MNDQYDVHPMTLARSAQEWTDQATRLSTARTRLSDASRSGFGPAASSAAATWTRTWGSVVGDLSDRATQVSEELTSASESYFTVDIQAQQRFQQWLAGAS